MWRRLWLAVRIVMLAARLVHTNLLWSIVVMV